MKYLISLFLILNTVTTFSQSKDYVAAVKQCLNSNGTITYYNNVVDDMFNMLQQQFKSQNVPEALWNELKAIKPTTLDNLTSMFASAYKGYFTQQDVDNMNAIYATKIGEKMFKNPNGLTTTEKVVITEFYKSETGQKILGSQDALNNNLVKVSEAWSGQLYQTVIEKLSEKGFNL